MPVKSLWMAAAVAMYACASCALPPPGVPVPDDDSIVVLMPPTSISACQPETCGTAP
jgi:hypothetical protein